MQGAGYPLNGGRQAGKLGSKYPMQCDRVRSCATVIQGKGRKNLRLIHLVDDCYPLNREGAGVAQNLP